MDISPSTEDCIAQSVIGFNQNFGEATYSLAESSRNHSSTGPECVIKRTPIRFHFAVLRVAVAMSRARFTTDVSGVSS